MNNVELSLPENDALVNDDLNFQLLESARWGDLKTVKKIVMLHPNKINCRDLDGRYATPLHLAAGISLMLSNGYDFVNFDFISGYNRMPVVQYLLENGAEVNAKDRSGLGKIPTLSVDSFLFYLPSNWR